MEAAKVSVVLVDDSTDVRTLVRMRLEQSGAFAVVGEAPDGEHAIDLLLRHEPDLVLLDVSTPSMDGLDTLPAILAIRPDTAVVMFTGFGGADLVARRGAAPGPSPAAGRRWTVELLDELGYAPAPDGEDREVVLHRCPLLQAAHRFPDVVCSVHLGMVQTALAANGADSEGSRLQPFSAPGQCYLRLGA